MSPGTHKYELCVSIIHECPLFLNAYDRTDTYNVIPRKLCESIPIQRSLQSLKCMEYEVADGHTIIYMPQTHECHIHVSCNSYHKLANACSAFANEAISNKQMAVFGSINSLREPTLKE